VFFPEIDFLTWNEISREDCEPDESNPYAYSFIVLEKKL
jgi:dihydrofolate reductase